MQLRLLQQQVPSRAFWCIVPPLLSAVMGFYSAHDVGDRRCRANNTMFQQGWAECTKEIQALQTGSFYDDFLNNPNEKRFRALCRYYEKWLQCLQRLATKCQMPQKEVEQGLGNARHLIAKKCRQKNADTARSIQCLASQGRDSNPLLRGCNTLLKLQSQTQSFNECSIMQEFFQCEDSLIRSACGSVMADLTYAVSLESKRQKVVLLKDCDIRVTPSPQRFLYNVKCPPDFPGHLQKCFREFKKIKLPVYKQMLAVTKGSQKDVDAWCSAYQRYKKCIEPLQKTCPDGVRKVYATEELWNRLLKIAEHLCDDMLELYKKYLKCYQQMSKNPHSFDTCKMETFSRFPLHHEAYHMKCVPNSHHYQELRGRRENLVVCYGYYVRKECGKEASQALTPLINIQYSYEFLPPCPPTPETVPCSSTKNGNDVTSSLVLVFMLLCLNLIV